MPYLKKHLLPFVVSLFCVLVQAQESDKKIEMAITVDDLPAHGQLPADTSRNDVAKKMVAVLQKYKVPEVYGFINAGKIEFEKENTKDLEIWRNASYPLGNHSYSHMDLHKASIKEFQDDVLRNEK